MPSPVNIINIKLDKKQREGVEALPYQTSDVRHQISDGRWQISDIKYKV